MLLTQTADAQTYYLGVLAPQGESAAQQRWQPWLDDINTKLQEDTLVLVPLALENWQEQIKAEQFDLVLGPQVQFVNMPTSGWRWLATLKNEPQPQIESEFKISDVNQSDFKTEAQYRLYQQLERELTRIKTLNTDMPTATEQIASALWVPIDSDIKQLSDLRAQKIVAVNPNAFGGYLLVAHLLQTYGVMPYEYETQFVGYPIELTLSTLASGAVDAAIAPLCLMEEMSAQGKIDQTQYRLIHPVTTESGCQSSTTLYPNWTLAATNQAPDALIEAINQRLFDTQAAPGSEVRWLPPESSASAERILYEMKRHPAQQSLGAYIIDWIKSHRIWMSVIVLIVLVSTINYGWMSWLAWRRRQQIISQNRLIRDYDEQLRQSERLAVMGEMSGAIAHEINQPLATIQNYAQGLLIRHQRIKNNPNTNTPKETGSPDQDMTQTALTNIVDETQRVAAIITNIRRWAKPVPTDEALVDIDAIYQQCILFMGDKASGISFWFGSDYQHITLPHLLLDQLLINGMINAQQQGAAHIMVRCQAQQIDDKPWLAIMITDDAGGFDEARLTHTHYTGQSTKTEGLGLGLMICQRLCKSLGGMMALNNTHVSDEMTAIRQSKMHYQLRQKRSLNHKHQLSQTEQYYPPRHHIGAQLILYLPLELAGDPWE